MRTITYKIIVCNVDMELRINKELYEVWVIIAMQRS
jgi:hypothetical protein